MRAPLANLGPNSQPWGRWVDNLDDAASQAILAMQADASSVGMRFKSRADNMEGQIAGIPSVSAIQLIEYPPFSVTRSGVNRNVFGSPVITINPPSLEKNYTLTVIVNMHASGVPFPYSDSLLRVNAIDFAFNHENSGPNFAAPTTADYSLMGSVMMGGAPSTVEFGIATTATGTVNFTTTQLWCIYSGSIA